MVYSSYVKQQILLIIGYEEQQRVKYTYFDNDYDSTYLIPLGNALMARQTRAWEKNVRM